MALTAPSTANEVKLWLANFFTDYVRGNEFASEMGTNENAVIHVKRDLTTQRGKTIGIPLIGKLSGVGVTGSGTLEGNEESLDDFNHDISVEQRRNAVLVSVRDQQFTKIGLLNAARPALQNWILEKTRDDILTQYGTGNGTLFTATTDNGLDSWLTDNADRVLFGDDKSNLAAGDFQTSLFNIAAGETLDYALVCKIKRLAKQASPAIRPAMVKNTKGEIRETYRMFVGSSAFRDLEIDMQQNHREAMERGVNNPLFREGDIYVRGVIVREVPEMVSLGPAGAAGAEIAPVYLCGAQSLGVAYAMLPQAIGETRDYGDKTGVGIREMVGFSKLTYTRDAKVVDHGVFTAFVAAADDT